LNTVTALTSNEMKEAFVKAGKIAASYRSDEARTAGLSATQPETDQPISASPHEGKASGEGQEDKVAATILDAEKKAVADIRAGRPAAYYFAPSELEDDASQRATSPSSGTSVDAAKK
jgi:hypothetical protein